MYGLTDFIDKRRGRITANAASVLSTPNNYANLPNVIARLQAANGAYWTTARVNQSTANDLVYALRQLDDAAGIK